MRLKCLKTENVCKKPSTILSVIALLVFIAGIDICLGHPHFLSEKLDYGVTYLNTNCSWCSHKVVPDALSNEPCHIRQAGHFRLVESRRLMQWCDGFLWKDMDLARVMDYIRRLNLLQEAVKTLMNGVYNDPPRSCNQIYRRYKKLLGEAPQTGYYYIQPKLASYRVYCEMQGERKGSTRVGRWAQSWDLQNITSPDNQTYEIELLSPEEQQLIHDLPFKTAHVVCDTTLQIEAQDHSFNPSMIKVIRQQSLSRKIKQQKFKINDGSEHTLVELTGCDQLRCSGREGYSAACGTGPEDNQLPARGNTTEPVVLASLLMKTGGNVRNAFTWTGTHYFLLLK
ncbi:uncharacterized protein LOC118414330 isoform X1 [Branchiostoma floridae]|uniref:Uncharacterized protein LOC118414330 isoform X1 n=1 Tax=Branchiostoma floridae TaxID=7739 RepID=A0A9J7L230_BRAFL|nr:uncharacterized protein LOC118414330 isoform X1 [Branchiostoma floridae]